MTQQAKRCMVYGGGLFFLLVLQYWSRYGFYPVSDYATDAWGQLYVPLSTPGFWSAAVNIALNDIDRPFLFLVNVLQFKMIGDNPTGYFVLSLVSWSFFLGLFYHVVYVVSHRMDAAFMAGLFFCVWPTWVENTHWENMIVLMYLYSLYMIATLAWFRFLERGNLFWLFLSAGIYFICVGSYEFGIALPAIFFLQIRPRYWLKKGWVMLPYILALGIYLSWRLTEGFGTAEGVYFKSREPVFALWAFKENVLTIVHWWVGGSLLQTIAGNVQGFLTIPGLYQFIFVVGCFFLLTLAGVLISVVKKNTTLEPGEFAKETIQDPVYRLAWLGLTWFVGGHALGLFSWMVPRLLIFPGIGLIMFLVAMGIRCSGVQWKAVLCLPFFVCLLANQGNAKNWFDTGLFNRNVYTYFENHRSEWEDASLILAETHSFRQRLTPGLLEPASESPHVYPYYHSASTVRGFALNTMLNMMSTTNKPPRAIMDVECGATWKGDILHWHTRNNPNELHTTPKHEVWRFNLFEAGTLPIEEKHSLHNGSVETNTLSAPAKINEPRP